MIIQHNMMALNSYNRLSGNNTLVSKNLEKLSSGFKINRAGDDAAGLAISEKMRAQITGLARATQNSQDGISLVQTAEGQLTEVHSMLNRMVDLATQSSNGTIDNDVDRKNLQKEVQSLKDEIDRIASTSHFNGIKLLDGSMGSGTTGAVLDGASVTASATTAGINAVTATLTGGEGLKIVFTGGTATATASSAALNGNTLTIDLKVLETASNSTTFNKDDIAKLVQNTLAGTTYEGAKLELSDDITITAGTDKLTTASVGKGLTDSGLAAGFTSAAAKQATVTNAATKVTVTSTKAGVDTRQLLFKAGVADAQGVQIAGNGNVTIGLDANKEYTAADINAMLSKAGADMTVDFEGTRKGAAGGADTTFLNTAYGLTGGAGLSAKGGLSLQIGDTADQRVEVKVGSMSVASLGLDAVNVSLENLATDSIDVIKTAINTVSSTRADLGAIQNRLEHTINNLTTTTENMTAAEARIRDTDMAKEMMAFTKNNVLAQAAQAMLAQANQQPQQVLQLLR